jgi:hypothetical protein
MLPVFALRPIRWFFLRTMNDPNDASFTVSPFSRQSVISLNTDSTSARDSDPGQPYLFIDGRIEMDARDGLAGHDVPHQQIKYV